MPTLRQQLKEAQLKIDDLESLKEMLVKKINKLELEGSKVRHDNINLSSRLTETTDTKLKVGNALQTFAILKYPGSYLAWSPEGYQDTQTQDSMDAKYHGDETLRLLYHIENLLR